MGMREATAADLAKYKGLSSQKCLLGTSERLQVIVDESKGTGKGYATAYVIPLPLEEEALILDVAAALKITLKEAGGSLVPAEPVTGTIELVLADKDAKVKRKVGADLEIMLSQRLCYAYLLGNWRGKLKTDVGDLEIHLLDLDSNGAYNDKVTVENGQARPADIIYVGELPETFGMEQYANILFLGEAVGYDGKLYAIEVSPTGESLEVRPYAGQAGKLRITAKDGRGKPASCLFALVTGEKAIFCPRGDTGREIDLPAGSYPTMAVMVAAKAPDMKAPIALMIASERSFTISKGKTTVVSFGGPMKMTLDPVDQPFARKRGEDLSLSVTYAVGQDQLAGVEDRSGKDTASRQTKFTITDGNGKVVHSSSAPFG